MTRTVTLTDGEQVPAIGLGTWRLGESRSHRAAEIDAVRAALLMGYRLVDTAEMYGDGEAETIVGTALSDLVAAGELRRDDVFVVSKVYPHNASRRGVEDACRRSLERLRLEAIDLYLLHWPGSHPLSQTVAGFEALREQGRIRHWGVSNFDVDGMTSLLEVDGGAACATNQVWYSAGQRGPEFDLFPWMRARRMPKMAYSPIDQSALARHPTLATLAAARGVSAATLALAWVMRDAATIAIPKSARPDHLRANLAALSFALDDGLCRAIDQVFPPPAGPQPLAIN